MDPQKLRETLPFAGVLLKKTEDLNKVVSSISRRRSW